MPTAPVLGLGLITAAACVEGSCGLEADLTVGTIKAGKPVQQSGTIEYEPNSTILN